MYMYSLHITEKSLSFTITGFIWLVQFFRLVCNQTCEFGITLNQKWPVWLHLITEPIGNQLIDRSQFSTIDFFIWFCSIDCARAKIGHQYMYVQIYDVQ